ncbi:hypothetical protein LAV73_08995 [Lysinibacillus xylanilyticus]|uniref:hypothetical protein n=1 Tax=Lysinibacillus xylanilyticus TaxID=582475 RepID=UPI002B25094B|nr:hypothetical protein [Lysinibacillus xylanilyticus]MEB2280131.1 hypothetical protein [Lysinibacillus xylanilyticus]
MDYFEYRNIHGKWRKRVGHISGIGKPQELWGLLYEIFKNDLLIEGVPRNGISYYSNLKLNLKSQL